MYAVKGTTTQSTQRIIFHNNGDPPHQGCGLIPKRYSTIRFVLLASSELYVKNPRLRSNYPPDGKKFDREEWYEVETDCEKNGQHDWYADISLEVAGAFDYYLTWDEDGESKNGKMGHFVVNPVLLNGDQALSLGTITLQTAVTKCIGPFSRWENYIKHTAAAGYNMIHFTPLQELGQSVSSYSLYHQHIISNAIFPNEKLSEDEKFDAIEKLYLRAKSDYGVFTLGELVLNHTANNSPWLKDHPEATYNAQTSPHLKPAIEFDLALAQLSKDLISGKYVSKYNIVQVTNEEDLTKVRKIIKEEILPSLRIWEYYIINADKAVGRLSSALLQKKEPSKKDRFIGISLNDEAAVQNLINTE